MQNKPNLCVFQAVSGDCEEKQTQTNPIQTQNKANFDPSATPQSQNKPNPNTNPTVISTFFLFMILPHKDPLYFSSFPSQLSIITNQ